MDYTIATLEELLEREFKHWDKLYHYGSYDPFYADDMGHNLIRNHLRIKEIKKHSALAIL